jgi:hypothetical protein
MRKYLFLALIVVFASSVLAQQTLPEPQYENTFMGLRDGKLLPLEHQTGSIRAGGGGFMVAKAKASYEYVGDKSPVRFVSGQPLDFVVRTVFAVTTVDPNTFFTLRKLDSKKKNRELVFMTGTFTPYGGSSKTDLSQGSVAISFSKFGANSLKLSVASLPSGEYAISSLSPQNAYCFGVD